VVNMMQPESSELQLVQFLVKRLSAIGEAFIHHR